MVEWIDKPPIPMFGKKYVLDIKGEKYVVAEPVDESNFTKFRDKDGNIYDTKDVISWNELKRR